MAGTTKDERLLNLAAFLLKAHRPVRMAEILESVIGYREPGASAAARQRRLARDMAALRELGVPLKRVAEAHDNGGYEIPRGRAFLPRFEVTPVEAATLSLAGRFAAPEAVGPLSGALRSALRKLQFDSTFPHDADEKAANRLLIHGHSARSAIENANLRLLADAVLDSRAVRFRYYAIGANREESRVVEPYGIGCFEGHWYLVGLDRGRKDVRVFRVDRFRGRAERVLSRGAEPEFKVPESFRMADYLGVPPWLFGTRPVTRVRIRFDADVAFMVRMRPAPGDQWEVRRDGSAVLVRRATNMDALLKWVLGFGRHAEVLDPPKFRRRVAETLQTLLVAHGAVAGSRAG